MATWEFRNAPARVGELIPVTSWNADRTHARQGFAQVVGQDFEPDENPLHGLRRVTKVGGPVVNQARTVALDESPKYVMLEAPED